MKSGLRLLDKSEFFSLVQKISKSNLINKTQWNEKNLNNQVKQKSNLVYSGILPNKERSKSVNAIMSSLLKQEKSNLSKEKKKNNKVIDILISESNEKNNSINNNDNDNSLNEHSNINSLKKENKNLKNKYHKNRPSYLSDDNNLINNNYGVQSMKNFLFLTRNLGGNKIKKKILNKLNTEENNNKKITIPSTISSINNTLNDLSNSKNKNINDNIMNGNDDLNSLSSRTILTHISNNSNNSNVSFFSSKSFKNNNSFRKNYKISNSLHSHLNSLNNKNKIYIPKLKFTDNLLKISNYYSSSSSINNNNTPYKIESFSNQDLITEKENIDPNNKILTSSLKNNINENKNIKKNESIVIELEDLIVLEEKIYYILNSFHENKQYNKLCIEWWNFYIYTSFGGNFEEFFKNEEKKNNFEIAHETSILELISIFLTYEVLKDFSLSQSILFLLINLINEVHQNFLIICDYILCIIDGKISNNNIWVNKLKNIISLKLINTINSNDHMILLRKGNFTINSIVKNILTQYENNKNDNIDISLLNIYFNKISETTQKELNEYFKKRINNDYCKKGENLSFIIPEINPNISIKIPYLNEINEKKFTLVLDLDDTLINFKYDNLGRGILKPRPNLFNFLNEMSQIFEIILFTAGTQDYADPILDIIEKKKKFFDKRLYRQHTILIDNILIKDLSKLGRDLSKVIIVDNMPQNFKLQKENGIFIKNFDGDKNDCKLKKLIPILKLITNNYNNDVRNELSKLKKEIFSKITTDLEE